MNLCCAEERWPSDCLTSPISKRGSNPRIACPSTFQSSQGLGLLFPKYPGHLTVPRQTGLHGAARPGIAHRLDVDTSGAIMVGKTETGFAHLRSPGARDRPPLLGAPGPRFGSSSALAATPPQPRIAS